MTLPTVEKKHGISPVWILPILAFCIGCWLYYSHLQKAGILIQVSFADSVGITVDKTPVVFKGNHVGIVRAINLSSDLETVELTIEMEKSSEPFLMEDMQFWVEKANVQAGRIEGLDTLLSGSYIGVQPGISDKPARKFVGLEKRSPISKTAPGLHLSLLSTALYSIQAGSGIYHKNIQIGSVQAYRLNDDETVQIDLFIKPEYQFLVKEKTRFWNASGLTVTGGLSGIKLHMESMAALFRGGIVMDTPAPLKNSPKALNGHVFSLYEDFEAAAYGIPLTLTLTSGKGITEGSTKIIYHGMKVGVVDTILLDPDKKNHSVSAKVLLDPRAKNFLKSGTRFFLVQPEIALKGITNLDTLLTGPYISFKPGSGKYQDHFTVDDNAFAYQTPTGTRFTLTARDAGSLSKGAPILLKRFQIGEVTDLTLSSDARQVEIQALIYETFVRHIKTTSKFYAISGIEVEANLSGIKVQTGSLESIISGGLAVYTPEGGPEAKRDTKFTLYEDNEAAVNYNRTKITIRLEDSRGLKEGASIQYRGAKIGEVVAVSYEKTYKTAVIDAMVDQQAAPLIGNKTQFWLVRPQISLAGSQHMDALFTGPYIEMAVEKGNTRGKTEFTALDSPPASALERTGLTLVLEGDELSSLKPGSAVFYRRVVVGEVVKCELSPTFDQVLVTVTIHEPYVSIVRENTKFWNASGIHIHGGVLSGFSMITESLQSIIAGGIALATPDNKFMGGPVLSGHRFKLYKDSDDEWLIWQPKISPVKP